MAIATDAQVQAYVDTRIRPRAEAFRNLSLDMADDLAVITDVFNACNQGSPTWSDNRHDGPPHLLAPSDVLAYNTVIALWEKFRLGTATLADVAAFAANWNTLQNACVRAPGG